MSERADRDDLEIEKIRAQVSNLLSDTEKLNAETRKITQEFQWYPFVLMTATIAATATIVKVFF